MTGTLVVLKVGHAAVQDLGRPGFAGLGIPVNGALDQHAARTANILVGNSEDASLVEIAGSELVVRVGSDVLIAATGAAGEVLIDGHRQPVWETLCVQAGSTIVVPYPATGFRSYLAVGGGIAARRVLGSVSADPFLGVGRRLVAGDRLELFGHQMTRPQGDLATLFRMGAAPVTPRTPAEVRVTDGPDLGRLAHARAVLDAVWRVRPQSDHVGLRLEGPAVQQTDTAEIASRGVPIGAVEVPPGGGIIMLLRGRMVTAGYPVVAVVTTVSLDILAQVRPGDDVRMSLCDRESAVADARRLAGERARLARRVQAVLQAKRLASPVS